MTAVIHPYAVDAKLFTKLLKKSNAIVDAIQATDNKTRAKKRLQKQLERRLPYIEKILLGIPAKDEDPFGEVDAEDEGDDGNDDDDEDEYEELVESQLYLEAYAWLCEQFAVPVPTTRILAGRSIVSFDYFGYTEALRRFPCPFPLPKFDDIGTLVGYIPNKELVNFSFKKISKKRLKEMERTLAEIDSAAEGDQGLAAFLAQRITQSCHKPEPAEIELAQSDLAEVFADVHKLGKDFLGIIVSG